MYNDLIFNRLNEEQKSFVSDFNHSILVSASAGTGKTTTMIRKILHLLLIEKVDISNLLVVTYTTAAASKMKHDLYNELQKAVACAKGDEAEINHISRQLDLINSADIGTIHSFCNKIIKKYFYEIGVEPNYSILSSEKSKSELINKAIDSVFEYNSIHNSTNFYRLYENFNTGRSDSKLRSCVIALYEYIICRQNSDEWLKDCLENSYKLDNSNRVWLYLIEVFKNKWAIFNQEIKSLYDLANACEHVKTQEFCVARIDLANKILESSSAQELGRHLEVSKAPNKPRIDTTKYPDLIVLSERLESVNEKYKTLKKETSDLFEVFNDEEFEANNEINKLNAEQLYLLVKQMEAKYTEDKAENNLLDFNDLEYYANKLCDIKDIVDELKDDYKYIFVDEYQDVNPMQDNLISKVAKSDNLYMIGDIKQSIYRFRQSSPEIFLNKYKEYKSGLVDKRVILFNKNFRSDGNILDFVNSIFAKCITTDCIGIDYAKDSMLEAGLKENRTTDSVKISLIDSAQVAELQELNKLNDEEEIGKREYEAELIAYKVMELVQSGFAFKDIAILLRDKKELARKIWFALRKYNIPLTVTIKSAIFESNEVLVLYALLKCVYNEADDIAFVTLLKSPICMCTEEELADIRLCAPDARTYYEACKMAEQCNENLARKISKIRNILKEFRLNMLSMNIVDALKKVIKDNQILNYYKSMPDGLEKECNINEFISIVKEQVYNNDLARLLDYIEVIKDKESEITITDGSDSVQIITMHSSKGLDYPAVIVGGFGENLVKNTANPLVINKDFGISVTGINSQEYSKIDNINTLAINLKNSKEEFEEAIRLMYVALTRPKKKLYITGVVDLGNVGNMELSQAKTYFDLFSLSLSETDISYFNNKIDEFELKLLDSNTHLEIIDLKDMKGSKEKSQIILDVSDPKLVTSLRDYHEREVVTYPNIAFKNSVTSILKEQEADYTNALDAFRHLSTKESLGSIEAMELGTQYHAVMQHIDFKDNNQDIEKLLVDLSISGYINPIYLGKIDVAKITEAKRIVSALINPNAKIAKEANFLTLAPHNELISNSECKEDVLVQGVIDLSIDMPSGVIIVDYKTNRTNSEEHLISTYSTQLSLYAKAYELAYNKKVIKKYLYSFYMGKLIEVK